MPQSVQGKKIGQYELLAQLTVGGMSQLFLGASTDGDGPRQLVVIKRIQPDSASDENFISMFLDEARITASFNHPSITRVLDLGEDDGRLFVAMELIAGANLNDVFDACASQQEVLPMGFSAAVIHDCATALHYAHTFRTPAGVDGSVIHRDVAQKNIMVTYDGEVKLLDFGIAKVRNAISRTKAGTVKGTAGYMSPEQVRGEVVDPRSDVFSLGIVLWEMITGRRLFSAGSEAEEMRLILTRPIEAPHDVADWIPESLSKVAMRALARKKEERFASAREFARALEIQCPELLYDDEQRMEFMHKLFTARIAATEALNEAARHPDQPALLATAVEGLEAHALAVPPSSPPGPKVSGPRRNKNAPAHTSPEEEGLLLLALEADRLGERPRRRPLPNLSMPFFVVITVLICVGLAYQIFVVERRPTRSGLQRFPGDPIEKDDDVPTTAEAKPRFELPGVDTHSKQPPQPQRADEPVATVFIPAPVLRVEKSPLEKRGARGEVTLALFPEASVFRGSEKLGSGNLMNFALPAGQHRLTVVGADGVEHSLPLIVSAGKNKPQRFRLEDLPAAK